MKRLGKAQVICILLFGAGGLLTMVIPLHVAAKVSHPGPIYDEPASKTARTTSVRTATIASALSVSCTAIPLSARLGESVLWYSSVTGGAGNYQYFWSGSDGLTGTTGSIRRTYDTPGSKTATVTVASGSQSVTIGCNAPVQVLPGAYSPTYPTSSFQNFGASCYAAEERIAPGESAAWLSVTTGLSPIATTTYKWEGTDGLASDGPAAFKTYTLEGRKHALLTVTSGNQRTVAACTNVVTVAPKTIVRAPAVQPAPRLATPASATTTPMQLQGVCAPSLAEAQVNEKVFWQATAIGGNGAYRFSWKGDDELAGEGTTSTKAYDNTGVKRAAVSISSDKQIVEVNCAPSIEVRDNGDRGLLAGTLFSGITSPFFIGLAVVFAGILGFMLARFRRSRDETKDNPPPNLPVFIQPRQEPR